MSTIQQKITDWYAQGLPFVAYRKPNESHIASFFQTTDVLFYTKNMKESGFVFAPFDTSKKTILIPENLSEYIQEDIAESEKLGNNKRTYFSNEKDKAYHLKIVNKAVQEIERSNFRKVVLSRKEVVASENFNLIETFQRLLKNYPAAMAYVWFHPKVGLWLGATPETLVKIKGDKFQTMSLAGTQVYNGTTNVSWETKEVDEQQIVTDFIIDKVTPICTNVSAEKVTTVKAGGLLHLKTVIKGKLASEAQSKLINILHPTPAVCGFPKEIAKKFILKNEDYNRAFYSGFLGELNINKTTDLFVNLRCMQVEKESVLVYVGGGITKESIAEKEWEETVSKSSTIKGVL